MALSEENAKIWRANYGKVVARAWSDEAFKAKLLSDPHAALADAGVDVPAGMTVNVVENTDDTLNMVLPPAPPAGELTEETLAKVVAGESGTTVSHSSNG